MFIIKGFEISIHVRMRIEAIVHRVAADIATISGEWVQFLEINSDESRVDLHVNSTCRMLLASPPI